MKRIKKIALFTTLLILCCVLCAGCKSFSSIEGSTYGDDKFILEFSKQGTFTLKYVDDIEYVAYGLTNYSEFPASYTDQGVVEVSGVYAKDDSGKIYLNQNSSDYPTLVDGLNILNTDIKYIKDSDSIVIDLGIGNRILTKTTNNKLEYSTNYEWTIIDNLNIFSKEDKIRIGRASALLGQRCDIDYLVYTDESLNFDNETQTDELLDSIYAGGGPFESFNSKKVVYLIDKESRIWVGSNAFSSVKGSWDSFAEEFRSFKENTASITEGAVWERIDDYRAGGISLNKTSGNYFAGMVSYLAGVIHNLLFL